MRVTYQDGRLYLSLTRSEVKQVHDEVGRPIELDIGNLSILHEDVSKCVTQYLRYIQMKKELSEWKEEGNDS
tara:strand:- start:231 stop:446 length:216 start_codon:yes stop_codon:yes gene_type:complete